MGKKLIIKGADFSANGIKSLIKKSSVTALFAKNGVTASYDEDTAVNEGAFMRKNGSVLEGGSNIAVTDFVSVSGCTMFVWDGSTDNVQSSTSALFVAFYDSNYQLLNVKGSAYIVPSSGDTDMQNGRYVNLAENLPVNQISGEIPTGAAYVRAATTVGTRRKGNYPSSFSVDLYGYPN